MTSPQGQDQPASRPFRLYGFATGDYMCKCMTCGETFIGDKRAVTCLPCAADQAEASRTPPPAVSEVREAVATLVMRWRCDMDHGDWPEDKAAALVGYLNDPHHGDCTKHPMTCLRCEAEAAYRMADQIIALQRGSEPADGSQVEPSTTGAGRHIPSTPPFIQWNGGENPAPGKEVRYRLREGSEDECTSDYVSWVHAGRSYDIIAYRIIPTDDQGGEGT